MKIRIFRFVLSGALLFNLLTPSVNVHAAGITVTNLNNGGTGSLRQAIIDAIAGGGAEITFSVSGTITLFSQLPHITAAGGELIIDGTGQTVTIDGAGFYFVLWIDNDAFLSLNNLTIAYGNPAGIYNLGTLNVMNSTFTNNNVNVMFGQGGGIFNDGGTITVTNSTFSGNNVYCETCIGGGIYNKGGNAIITNSTFSGNAVYGPVLGGVGIVNGTGMVMLRNTILANNMGLNCGGTITNGGNNIDDGTTCGWASANGSMSSTDPLLGSLADNGGSTRTFALLAGSSPAYDGVTYSPSNNAPSTDQRGIVRPQGARYDIGSYEYVQFRIYLPLMLRN